MCRVWQVSRIFASARREGTSKEDTRVVNISARGVGAEGEGGYG